MRSIVRPPAKKKLRTRRGWSRGSRWFQTVLQGTNVYIVPKKVKVTWSGQQRNNTIIKVLTWLLITDRSRLWIWSDLYLIKKSFKILGWTFLGPHQANWANRDRFCVCKLIKIGMWLKDAQEKVKGLISLLKPQEPTVDECERTCEKVALENI